MSPLMSVLSHLSLIAKESVVMNDYSVIEHIYFFTAQALQPWCATVFNWGTSLPMNLTSLCLQEMGICLKRLWLFVTVHLSCYNKIYTLDQRTLLLIVQEAGRPRSRHWQIWHIVRALSFTDGWFLAVSSHARKDKFFQASFIQALVPFMRTLPS